MSAAGSNRPPLVTADGTLTAAPIDLQLAAPSLRVHAAAITFRHAFAMGTPKVPAAAPFVLQADLTGRNLLVDDLAKGLNLARLTALEVTGADLQGQQQMTVQRLRATGLQALEQPAPGGNKPLHFLAWRELLAEGTGVSGGQVNAGQITLNGLEVHLARDEQGRLDVGPWLPKTGKPNAGRGRKVAFRIGRVDLRDGKLLLIDRSLQPTARLEMAPLRAHLENLDSSGGGKPAVFSVDLQMQGHAFSLHGQGEPFAPEPAVKLHLQTSGFPLTPVLPYLPTGQFQAGAGLLDLNGDLGLHYRPADQHLQMEYAGAAGVRKFRGTAGQIRLPEVNLGWNGTLRMTREKTGQPALAARGKLHAGPLQIATPTLDIRLRQLQVEENFASGSSAVPAGAKFLLEGKAALHDLQVDNPAKKLNLARLPTLEITGARIQGPEQITVERVRATGLRALAPPAGKKQGRQVAGAPDLGGGTGCRAIRYAQAPAGRSCRHAPQRAESPGTPPARR